MKYTGSKFAKCLKSAVLTVAIIGAGSLLSGVQAQTTHVFEIEVPFDFVAKGRTYEAGTYRIGRLSESNPDMLVLKTVTGKKPLILQTTPLDSGEPAGPSKLSFRRFGEVYVLDSLRASGESYERRLRLNKSNRNGHLLARSGDIISITGK